MITLIGMRKIICRNYEKDGIVYMSTKYIGTEVKVELRIIWSKNGMSTGKLRDNPSTTGNEVTLTEKHANFIMLI